MALSAGIVGLPNVGKSTLFNAITNLNVEAANYPFATINPNVGIVPLNDDRLDALAKIINPQKVVNATFQFVDIAGLVKGASRGEGLGNQFLSNIREVDMICHVVRCFESKDIMHVESRIDPILDSQIINTELILSDVEVVQKKIQKISKKASSGDKNAIVELELCKKLINHFENLKFASTLNVTSDEYPFLLNMQLITTKPMIYIANIDENFISNPTNSSIYNSFLNYARSTNIIVIPISAKIESEISRLSNDDKKVFMNDLNITQSGLDLITKTAFSLLNLRTYFTFGEIEVRAWTFQKGWKAPKCAGVIHTDFEKGFIKAEIVSWVDLIEYKSILKCKENGKLRLEGKEYEMQDGDVCNFKFNVTK